jgi:putative membrane protein
MLGVLLRMALVALGLYIASRLVPGVAFDDIKSLILAALVLAVVNAVIRPLLILLTLPFTIITLGLFIFIINAALFYGVSLLLPGFHLADFGSALLGSIVVSLTSGIGTAFIGRRGRVERLQRYRQHYRNG